VIHVGWVYVFEDGRVISHSQGTLQAPLPYGYREQRLTPEGVDLVGSGALDPAVFLDTGPASHHVPAGAWDDSTLRPYVPYRYAICGVGPLQEFPAAARDLLRGREETFHLIGAAHGKEEGFGITTGEARVLDDILADARFYIGSTTPGDLNGPGQAVYDRWWGEAPDGIPELAAAFKPILPHGDPGSQGGG
jgi:hypothetical protein